MCFKIIIEIIRAIISIGIIYALLVSLGFGINGRSLWEFLSAALSFITHISGVLV